MPLTLAEEQGLRDLLARVGAMDENRFDKVKWVQWNGRVGEDTSFLCRAAPAGHVYTQADIDALGWPQSLVGARSAGPARWSLDSGGNPTFMVVEYAADALVPGTIPTVMDLRNLATNPKHSTVIFDLSINQARPVFFRLNGMNMVVDAVTRVLSVPLPHSLAAASAQVNAYAFRYLHRNLSGAEQTTILTQWPGPAYTDADLDEIELLIDTLA